jgi:hypothetical protein
MQRKRKWETVRDICLEQDWPIYELREMAYTGSEPYRRGTARGIPEALARELGNSISEYKKVRGRSQENDAADALTSLGFGRAGGFCH